MFGFVLPAVAIHHLWRNRKRERRGTFPPPPTPTHTHTHTHTRAHTHTPLQTLLSPSLSRHPALSSTRALLNYPRCFPHSIPGQLSFMGHVKGRGRRRRGAAALFRKHLAHKDSLSFPPINPLLKGGCNSSSVNALGVESILPGFPNLEKRREKKASSKHLIRA